MPLVCLHSRAQAPAHTRDLDGAPKVRHLLLRIIFRATQAAHKTSCLHSERTMECGALASRTSCGCSSTSRHSASGPRATLLSYINDHGESLTMEGFRHPAV